MIPAKEFIHLLHENACGTRITIPQERNRLSTRRDVKCAINSGATLTVRTVRRHAPNFVAYSVSGAAGFTQPFDLAFEPWQDISRRVN